MIAENDIKIIVEFEKSFETYYNALHEYYRGGLGIPEDRRHPYKFNHPDLNRFTVDMHACFLALPKVVREKLMEVGFEWFVHHNNSNDFYNFRRTLIEKELLGRLATISGRVGAIISLAKRLAEKGCLERLAELPEKNFDFPSDCERTSQQNKEDSEKTNQNTIAKNSIDSVQKTEHPIQKWENNFSSVEKIINSIVKIFKTIIKPF